MKYKFTRVYVVEAPTQAEAFAKCRKDPTRYNTYQSVAIESGDERRPWREILKKQITGK